jgi:hypothetical protein
MSQVSKVLLSFLLMTAIVGTGCDGESKKEKNEKAKQEVNKNLNNLSSVYQQHGDLCRNLISLSQDSVTDKPWTNGLELALTDAKAIPLPEVDKLSLPDLEAFKGAQDQVIASAISLSEVIRRSNPVPLAEWDAKWRESGDRIKSAWDGYNKAATTYNETAEDGKDAPILTTVEKN